MVRMTPAERSRIYRMRIKEKEGRSAKPPEPTDKIILVRKNAARRVRAYRMRKKAREGKNAMVSSCELNGHDLLSIGEKFGQLMFSLLSGSEDLRPLQDVTRQFSAAQSFVGLASNQIRTRRLPKDHPGAEEGAALTTNLRVKTTAAPVVYTWNPTSSDKNPDTKSLIKSVSKRFGPRRNSRGYNYAAQLCFMKDEPFARRVGVSRTTYEDLLMRIHESQKDSPPRRSHEISTRIRLLMSIIYLTSKKVYRDIHYLFGYSEAAVCRLIYKTINEINMLSSNAIKWPADLEVTSGEFFKKCDFPGVIGAIDAIHLVARAPEKLHDEYRNTRGKYTIILLAICDGKKKFTYVSVGYPGTFTDQKCLDSTDLGINLDNIPNDYFPLKKYHLLANDNFNLREGLMVPYKTHEIQCEDQVEFNKRLLATQAITSNTFVEMKSRFQTLSKLDMNIERVVEFTTACCILHNVCLDNNDPWTGPMATDDDSSSASPEAECVIPSTSAAAKRDIIRDQMYLGLHYG